MDFGAAGALDDVQSQEGFLHINQMADMLYNCIKKQLNVADDDTVNVADVSSLVNLPFDALKDYVDDTGRISINGIVNCAVSQLAQNNVRSIRTETQDTQARQQGSTLRRLTGELKAITRRRSEILGAQPSNSFDPAPSIASLLGSNTHVFSSIAGSTHPQGFNIATFNELKTKNSDLSTQLSKADKQIGELKKLVLDKDYEIAQLNERIKGLMTDAASVVSLPQRTPSISSAELQSLQATLHEPLIVLRGMLQDLHTAIVPAPLSGPADNFVSDETGLVDMNVGDRRSNATLKERVAKILTATERILEGQNTAFKQLEEKDASILKVLTSSFESVQSHLSSTQDVVITTLEKRVGSINAKLADTVKDYIEHLFASIPIPSTCGQQASSSDGLEKQVFDTVFSESRVQSRIELKEVIRDIMAASSESLIAKLDEIKREVVKVERTDSESTVGDRLMPTDLASVIAAQTSELSLILSDVQGKVIEGVSTHIEQRLSQLQLELARNMHNLKELLTQNLEAFVHPANLSGKPSASHSSMDSMIQHWDASLVEGIAQEVALKIQARLDQYRDAVLSQIPREQTTLYDQQPGLVSGVLQAFVDSVFPDLKEGFQELITKQFTIHMETFAEEQLRFAEALCCDFKSILLDDPHRNHSQQMPISEATRLENMLPLRASPTVLTEEDNPGCSPQEIVQGVSKLLEKKAPVISGIITKASKRSLAAASRRDSGRLEESALIVFNDENDNVIDALVKEKDLLNICPGLANEETGLQGKPLTEISLAIDQICTQPAQSNVPESFHTLRFPPHSFQTLQHYLPETNTKLDLIEDHILRQFADVRSSIDGLTKSINTSTYITSSEAARMRQEYRDVAMTIDDINDGLAAVIESESARTLSNLRHIVWADYITVTAVLALTLVIFFNLIVVLATHNCT
ncbi:hypothetical protein GL50803_0014071 [Giardia duodenalis]|uniref:Uncharacterized protein n=1 Tax=Giardia intestinalis (strain ATCC 50803 / WB clone C6) TaxID=184922 RepID=A8BKK1_GIAIC|nr:hypothetical protein GL50803_0014071 [Giardia intestinalis]KAE8301476.1 hypothetical protein GL50803_0014071 [Giardia intestinalis]|eukprot:XP_001706546.1 Hypothetical protein GL50803_14071 [Giardia lamblia ATCC 50803]